MQRQLSFLRTLWRNQRRQPDLPRFLTYIVTFTCNARCIMCDSWKKPSPNDLDLDEIAGIFRQLPRMDAVRLSGGEPFVRRDLLEIAHLVQSELRPFFLHITTNGFLTDRIVEFCEERRKDIPLKLLISVDGLEEKHNEVRGHGQAWSYVNRTLEALTARRRELSLDLMVNQTIVDAEGAEHYRKLQRYLEPLGIRNNAVMAYDASATYHLEDSVEVAPTEIGNFTTFGDFGAERLDALFTEMERDLPRYPLAERLARRYYLRGIRNRLLGNQGAPNPKCVALNSHLRLLPDGTVPTCQFNTRSAGSLREQTFAELWESERLRKQRQWVQACPGCWAECEVLPSAIYTGDLLAPAWLHRRPPNDSKTPRGLEERRSLPVV